ncbi:hypothetical protein DES43_14222 [Aquamicrobium defluvii]|uniref:Uncharacterized protein n=1 Tax=Aquamicrobium defluvii TaxID=69279 RepID=A0A4R6Y5F1_9HYPH|nr:hypothetical protein DES43_14222 [Aquamicrobium defluvii]
MVFRELENCPLGSVGARNCITVSTTSSRATTLSGTKPGTTGRTGSAARPRINALAPKAIRPSTTEGRRMIQSRFSAIRASSRQLLLENCGTTAVHAYSRKVDHPSYVLLLARLEQSRDSRKIHGLRRFILPPLKDAGAIDDGVDTFKKRFPVRETGRPRHVEFDKGQRLVRRTRAHGADDTFAVGRSRTTSEPISPGARATNIVTKPPSRTKSRGPFHSGEAWRRCALAVVLECPS